MTKSPISLTQASEFLLARGSLPILYWLKKDIMDVPADRDLKNLGMFGARVRILETQQEDGSWALSTGNPKKSGDKTECLIKTLKNVSRLYEYGCPADDPRIERSIRYLFSLQAKEGDFRASSPNEYTPGYHALTLEVLCRFGLDGDARIKKGFRWIMSHRQADGGWAIPSRTLSKKEIQKAAGQDEPGTGRPAKPLQSDPSKPFSHFLTGLVLRALAESPTWRTSGECRRAGDLVLSRFFMEDKYEDRREAKHWTELSYPFWSTNILSCLDSLSRIGFDAKNPKIRRALGWLLSRRNPLGYWESQDERANLEDHLWLSFAVLRVFRRFGLLKA